MVFEPPRINKWLKANNRSGRVHLIPSHLGLINVDLELATELGGASVRQSKQRYLKVHHQLARALRELAEGEYDVVLLDCPPNFNIVTKNALIASDSILVPALPDYLSTLGIDYLVGSVNELIEDFNEYLEVDVDGEVSPISPGILGVVFTMIQVYGGQPIAAQRGYVGRVRSSAQVPVFKSFMRKHPSAFVEAPENGIPVVLATQHDGVREELEAITTEFWAKAGIPK